MTVCELITKPIIRMVDEKKDLDEIAGSVCPLIEGGREKIIRIIKDFLGEDYLNEHADTLKYNVKMAELAKKRTHKKIDATTDTVIESNSVLPVSSCQTTVQAVNTEHEGEAGQTGQEQVLDVHDMHSSCCQAVRKVGKTDSENKTEGDSGEMKGQEKVVEEQDDAPIVNVQHELIVEIIILIKKYSLESVKKSIDDAELYMLHGAIEQN